MEAGGLDSANIRASLDVSRKALEVTVRAVQTALTKSLCFQCPFFVIGNAFLPLSLKKD
jgi:hypothetical protein